MSVVVFPSYCAFIGIPVCIMYGLIRQIAKEDRLITSFAVANAIIV